MKITVMIAAAVLGLAAAAHADSEGNGEPFPFRVPGVATAMVGPAAGAPAVASLPTARPSTRQTAEAHPAAAHLHL